MTADDHDLAASIQARVGQTVCGGKYRIEQVLGVGGMAAVYAAVHRNGRRVAMKLLHPEYSVRADIRKRFLREGQAANAVNHPGVVAVIDDDIAEDGAAFLVMERLEGRTLESIWEDVGHRLPTGAVLAIARELCSILAAAHKAGIVHRDLKPENIFLTNEGQLKVLDFGLAQLRDATRPKDTHTGMIFGTPAFMPPEQATGRISQIDARTDIWAVGATLFTLLSGRMVFEGETPQHFVMLSATEPARSLAAVLPYAHPLLVAFVDRALSRDKQRRWQSAEAMLEAAREASKALLGSPELPLMTPAAIVEAIQRPIKRKDAVEDSSSETETRPPQRIGLDDTVDAKSAPTDLELTVVEHGQSVRSSSPPTDPARVNPAIDEPETLLRPNQEQTGWSDLRNAIENGDLTSEGPTNPKLVSEHTALMPVDAYPHKHRLTVQTSSETPTNRLAVWRPANLAAARSFFDPRLNRHRVPVALAVSLFISAPIAFFAIRGRDKDGSAAATSTFSFDPAIPAIAETPGAPSYGVGSVTSPTSTAASRSGLDSSSPDLAGETTPEPGVVERPNAPPSTAARVGPPRPRTSTPVPRPSSRPSATPPNCTPPYVRDVNGDKHWKPECF